MSQFGLAIVEGSTYKIKHDEGQAIASFVPPPELENIDSANLNPERQFHLWKYREIWQVVGCWLVYYRTRAVNIREYPFTSDEYLDRRELAELCNCQLELCTAIWEEKEITHLYKTPYEWWTQCIWEQQKDEIEKIKKGSARHTKGAIEDGLRFLYQKLKADEIPFAKTPSNQHLYRLYRNAINMRLQNSKVRKAWKEYLKALLSYARAIKDNKNLKAFTYTDHGLYYRDGNSLRQMHTGIF